MNAKLRKIEMMRGLAALYVMAGHLLLRFFGEGSLLGLPLRFGQEAVMLFFLISGFVVLYSTEKQRPDFPTYLGRRWLRIYPIFLLAIGVCAFDIAVLRQETISGRDLLGNLFMLQDFSYGKPGVWFSAFGGNSPLWSLAYEWWFYMMFFPINRWVPERRQKYFVSGLCGLGLLVNFFRPNPAGWFLVFFPIWWAGVELAKEFLATGQITLSRQKTMLALLAGPMLWFGLLAWQWQSAGRPMHFIDYPLVDFRYFFMCIVFLLLTLLWKNRGFAGFNQTLGRFGWLGSISYALYLFHYPIICDLRLLPGESSFYLDLGLRILLALALAWLAEAKLQKWINARTDRWLKSRRGH